MNDVSGGLVIEDEESDADLTNDASGGTGTQLCVPLSSAIEEATRYSIKREHA